MLGYGCMGQVAIGQGPYALPFPPAIYPDGGYAKRKKRRGPDLLDIELEEKAKRRAAIELAVYGPEVVDPPTGAAIPQAAPYSPPNVEDLARAIVQARTAELEAYRRALEQDEEDTLEMILRDL